MGHMRMRVYGRACMGARVCMCKRVCVCDRGEGCPHVYIHVHVVRSCILLERSLRKAILSESESNTCYIM